MKRIFMTLAALSAMVFSASAAAQFQKPADAVKYRQGAYAVISVHTQRISAMLKGETPLDKAAVEANAAVIESLAKQLTTAFPADSNLANSKAKPEVWEDKVHFKSKMDDFVAAAAKFSASARSTTDVNTLKTSFGGLTQSCKACHDDYRTR